MTEIVASCSADVAERSVVKTRLGMCEVCAYESAKYTCPNCEVKSCSLRCSGIHKRELECDGVRNKAKYVPLKRFTDTDLSSDYRLLEEVTRSVESLRNNRFKNMHTWTHLPNNLFKIRKAAERKQIKLLFLPHSFARRKANTTCVDRASNDLRWRVDWVFANADGLTLSDDCCVDTEKLAALLKKYFAPQEDAVLQERLQYYRSVGVVGVRTLLKAEGRSGKKFFELDLSVTLRENLRKRTIIEYPIVHVVLKHLTDAYEIVDSDSEEVESEKMEVEQQVVAPQSGNEIISKILKTSENEDSVYGSLKNLLFVSEYSDGDLSD